jgi:hypothetical protein
MNLLFEDNNELNETNETSGCLKGTTHYQMKQRGLR